MTPYGDDNQGGFFAALQNPANQGLLAAGLAMLSGARGPNSQGAVGTGGLAGLQAFQNAQAAGDVQSYRQAQIRKLQQDARKNDAVMAFVAPYLGGAEPGGTRLAEVGTPARGALLAGAIPAGSPGLLGGGAQAPSAGSPGGLDISNMSLQQLAALKMAGLDLTDIWKMSKEGFKRQAGDTIERADGTREHIPRAPEGTQLVYGPNGPMLRQIPGYSAANAAAKAAEAGAVAAAQYPYQVGQTNAAAAVRPARYIGPDGNEYATNDLALAQGTAGAQGTPMVGRNPLTQQAASKVNDDWVTNSYRPALDDGKTASGLVSSLQAFRAIPLETGWGTEAKAAAANMLTGLGMAPDAVAQYASDAQKFQAVAMERLNQTLLEQKGMQTEGDAERASKTFARLSNTPQANRFIVDFAQAQANQRIRKAQYYEAALPLAQRTGDLARVDREWRKIQGSIWNDPLLAPYRQQEQR
ncbi:hypothetical protein [Achromobacter sp. GD03932]|uniref:hypothetical protein n=1 Tax=Achromobacter sp. GD03932 TaxID=2975407 RepID=UPI00244BDE80|nr:hypothetical protein [Achromobacter sp. GD03932]MDH1299672.1 hypothetical protein [Achromobacter sp. GD03932]